MASADGGLVAQARGLHRDEMNDHVTDLTLARGATDPRVRRVLDRIAAMEVRHAGFSAAGRA